MAQSTNTKAQMKFDSNYDVAYITKSGRGYVAHIQAKSEEEAKEKLKKEMQASSTFDKIITVIKMEHGGKLDEIYHTGTAQQLWEAWDEKIQRPHFLVDHADMFNQEMGSEPRDFNASVSQFSKMNYSELPKSIQKQIIIHHALGIYEHGGKIASTGNTVEIIKPGHHYLGKKGLVVDFIPGSKSIEVRFTPPEISEGYDEEFFKQKDVKIISERRRSIPSVSAIMQENGGKLEEEIGEHITGIGIGSRMKLAIYKKDGLFSVYNEKNKERLSIGFSDQQQARAFMQGVEQGYENKLKPEYVKARNHLVKVNGNTILKTDRKEVADAYIQGFEKSKIIKLNEGGKLSPSKQKIQNRIDVLNANLVNIKSAKAKEAVQKKIDKFYAQINYKPTAKQRAQANQGKFAMDVPSGMSKAIYKKLWSMKIFPKIHKLNGTSSIVVDSGHNLDMAYKVYSDIADKKVPPLSKISRKL